MKIMLFNIDGSDLAMWFTDMCYTPSFQNLPNHDARCPYSISINGGKQHNLRTGVPLNHAIREAIREWGG